MQLNHISREIERMRAAERASEAGTVKRADKGAAAGNEQADEQMAQYSRHVHFM